MPTGPLRHPSPLAFAAALSVGLLALEARAQDQQTITIGVGQQKVISVPGGVQRLSIGEPEIADVKAIGNNEVLVLGVGEGRTTLLIWRPNDTRLSYLIS